jgi:vacuolar-type H+-ATPase subunit H
MSAEKTAINVEAIEAEAEKILQTARTRANEILMKANEEANTILSSGTALDQVKAKKNPTRAWKRPEKRRRRLKVR